MRLRGICYDVGRVIAGENQRPVFDLAVTRRDLQIIRDELHCNTVRICGLDLERIRAAADEALEQDLDVWLSPELFDHSAEETLTYLGDAAIMAEEIRRGHEGKVVLSVGSELTMFMRGILPGETVLDRIGNPLRLASTMLRLKLLGSHNRPLNDFLRRAAATARERFHGPISYASVPIEDVDWDLFDIVGVDLYRGERNRDSYGATIERYIRLGKPVVVTEVGCATYQGAQDRGGRAFAIVDRKHPDTIKRGYVRDEALQARELQDMLRILRTTGIEGTFVFTFMSPTLIHTDDPRHDFDMASYSIVKTLPDNGVVESSQPDPNLNWEPKEAFDAVARSYSD